MLPKLLDDAKNALEAHAKFIGVSVAVDAIIAALAAVALFFFTLAGFRWTETEYGTVAACLVFGAFFLILAAALFVAARIRARRFARAEAQAPGAARSILASATRPGDKNDGGAERMIAPLGIAAAIEILRAIGARRLIPAFVVTAIVVTALQTSNSRAKDKAESEADK